MKFGLAWRTLVHLNWDNYDSMSLSPLLVPAGQLPVGRKKTGSSRFGGWQIAHELGHGREFL